MNSFIENVNYVANLDNKYGRSVELFKNNISLRTESYDVKIKFTYYNYQTSELIDVLAPYNAVSISGFESMINNFKSQINALIGGNKFICTSAFSYTNFVINNVATVDIKINSLDDMIKTYGLNITITSGSNELYNINGIVNDTLKILPSVALFDSESLIGIKEINNNIVGLNLISSNINEILLANDNAISANENATLASNSAISATASATIATTKASEASTSASNAASNATASANSATSSATSATAAATSAASAAAIAGGSISLDSLNNVTVPTPANGDILSYVTATTDWRPLAILPATKGGTGVVTSTGSGNNVLSTSPTLVTPNIGTATGISFNSITGLSSVVGATSGPAAVGTSTTAARADHVHPIQTTITGNAATASKLQTARAITLSGDVSGSVNFDGSENVSITTTIGANSVILGTDTTGNYVAGLTQGTGINITGSVGEGWSPNVSLADVGTAGTYRSVTTDAKGRITAGTNPTTVSGYGLTDVYTKTENNTSMALKVNNSEKGVANGVATLDANGKVVLTQIPDSVLGQLEYIGTWNFATLPTATQKGQYWIASASGNGYVLGDWAVWNGTAFDKVDNTDAVATVAGRTGNVVLTKTDIGLDNVDNTADSAKPVSTAQQAALNLKANLASPVFTGNVTGLGVATGTSFNSITGLSSTVPVVNGVATIGTSTTVAKADHIHPGDTTKITKVSSTDNAIVRFDGITGAVQNSSVIIDDNGNLLLTSGTGGLGYGTGAGGTVTQLTSKGTAVTLNKPTGQIIMKNDALAAGASAIFIINCSALGQYDNVNLTICAGISSFANYSIDSFIQTTGQIACVLSNITAGTLSESVTINFMVIKGANS